MTPVECRVLACDRIRATGLPICKWHAAIVDDECLSRYLEAARVGTHEEFRAAAILLIADALAAAESVSQ